MHKHLPNFQSIRGYQALEQEFTHPYRNATYSKLLVLYIFCLVAKSICHSGVLNCGGGGGRLILPFLNTRIFSWEHSEQSIYWGQEKVKTVLSNQCHSISNRPTTIWHSRVPFVFFVSVFLHSCKRCNNTPTGGKLFI